MSPKSPERETLKQLYNIGGNPVLKNECGGAGQIEKVAVFKSNSWHRNPKTLETF